MSAAILAPSAFSLDQGGGVSHLENASLPLPTDAEWAIAGLIISGIADELADPRPDAFDKVGLPGPVHGLTCFDRIHVIPRERDLGAVVSEQQIQVEVWNAFLNRARIMREITVEGPQGIEVIDHLGQPAHFAASVSEVYSVLVSAEGDPTIDNLVTWDFDGISNDSTGLWLRGFRMIPFPFEANMVQSIVERFGYLTDLMVSHSGMEQRVQLRSKPVGTISFAVTMIDSRAAQMAAAMLFGNQARVFAVPRWQYRLRLEENAAADDVNVYCTTAYVPLDVDGLVMLWTDPFTWEVHTIAEVHADRVVLSSGLRFAWTAGITTVVPVVLGRLSTEEALRWESLKMASQIPTFTVEKFEP